MREVLALVGGALLIGLVPIFVRFSDAGPSATAFWRMALASGLLVLATRPGIDSICRTGRKEAQKMMWWSGAFFALDLAFFHWAIALTTVASASLMNNLAPAFAGLFSLFLGVRLGRGYWAGLVLAIGGIFVLVGGPGMAPEGVPWGELSGIVSAVFFALYLLSLERARRGLATWTVMLGSGISASAVLLPIALLTDTAVLPQSATGWLAVVGLAAVCHLAGQALLTFAMARISGAMAALGMLLQPVAAAGFAAVLFAETLSPAEIMGALVVLAGLGVVLFDRARR